AGSAAQARRRAACRRALGTPRCINAVMSVPALIDSIDGRLLTSNSLADGPADISEPTPDVSFDGSTVCAGSGFFDCAASVASRLGGDQRLMNCSSSFPCVPRPPAALGAPMLRDWRDRAYA